MWHFGKLTVSLLLKNFTRIFYEKRIFISVLIRIQNIHILSQTNPVHDLTSSFFKIYFNITLPSMPRSSKLSVPSNEGLIILRNIPLFLCWEVISTVPNIQTRGSVRVNFPLLFIQLFETPFHTWEPSSPSGSCDDKKSAEHECVKKIYKQFLIGNDTVKLL